MLQPARRDSSPIGMSFCLIVPRLPEKGLASVVTTDSRVAQCCCKESTMSDLTDPSEDRPARGAGATLLTLAGVVGAFGVASCCGLPFLLATFGLGTAWLG